MAETLPQRIEAAEGADRALDRAIWYALQSQMSGDPAHCPTYTASIDAALTLAPEGWDFSVQDHREDGAYAEVWKHGYHDDTVLCSQAITPALALCAAALRAKDRANG